MRQRPRTRPSWSRWHGMKQLDSVCVVLMQRLGSTWRWCSTTTSISKSGISTYCALISGIVDETKDLKATKGNARSFAVVEANNKRVVQHLNMDIRTFFPTS